MKAGKVRAVTPPGDGGKRLVSVVEIVVWAYRDQMVHAARPEGMPVEIARDWSPKIAQSDFAKEIVSSSVKLDFAAAPDAYRVHDAVSRLPVVERRRTAEELSCLLGRKLCSNELLRVDAEQAGHRVDVDRGAEARGDATMLPPTEQISLPSLVFDWAMKGKAPEWVAEPMYVYERGRALCRGARKERFFQILKPVGDDPLEVEHQRSLYTLWVGALAQLRADLVSKYRLTNHALAADLPPMRPWEIQATVDMGQKLA